MSRWSLLAALLLAACTQAAEPVTLPSGLGSGSILLLVEDTSGETPVLRAVYGALLDGNTDEIANVLRAPPSAAVHYTVLHYNESLAAFGLSPGALRVAGEGEGRRTLPRPAAGYRLRAEADGYHTPWRDYAIEAPLDGLLLYVPCTDQDGDGYGDFCALGPDCDDAVREVHPGAEERCNDRDDDCNGAPDDGFLLGRECYLPESGGGGCYLSGREVCAADTIGVACEAGATPERVCCPAGELPGESNACCLSEPATQCALSCVIDLVAGTHDCSGPLQVQILPSLRAIATLTLIGYSGVEIGIDVCDPTGWTFHLADSPSCNGGGGDAGDRSNDAEAHITNGDLFLWGNDSLPIDQLRIYTSNGFLPPTGCTTRTLRFQDQRLRSVDPCFDVSSPSGLRLNPPADFEGPVDSDWYLGLNTTFTRSPGRDGMGVRRATFCVLP